MRFRVILGELATRSGVSKHVGRRAIAAAAAHLHCDDELYTPYSLQLSS